MMDTVAKRRRSMAGESSEAGDLLSILLEDPLFKDDDEMITDEILTFFFAGS